MSPAGLRTHWQAFALADKQAYGLVERRIRVGTGWDEVGLAHSGFSIGDTDLRPAGNVSVDVYLVTENIVLSGPALSCVSANENKQSCDWDLMFFSNPPSDVTEVTGSQQFIEYS